MSSDNRDAFPDQPPSYEDRWQAPEVEAMLRQHLAEQVEAGIYAAYHAEIERHIPRTEAYHEEAEPALIRAALRAELPLVIVADTARDMDGKTIQFASPIALVKADPTTGHTLYGSFLPVANVNEGKVSLVMGPFTAEQADLLLRQANEQITVGLHPELIYNAPHLNWPSQ